MSKPPKKLNGGKTIEGFDDKILKGVGRQSSGKSNYKYSQSVINKANKDGLYHDFPIQLDKDILDNLILTRSDGRIEHLAHGYVNGTKGVYQITTKDKLIIPKTFIPVSDWTRFSSVNGLPENSDIPLLK